MGGEFPCPGGTCDGGVAFSSVSATQTMLVDWIK